MEEQKITVIIPAYNVQEYLRRCLDSVLNQTYSNLEVIVIDDGSTDQTGSIVDEYAANDERVVPIHKANGGVSSARIEGLMRATGDYIGFVDSDDYVELEMYSCLMKNALKYDADISHCGYKMIYPDGHEDLYYGSGRLVIQSNKKGLCDLLEGSFIEPCLCNKLYRNTIVLSFQNEKIWDTSIKYSEDLLLNYIYFKYAKLSVFDDKTYYHYLLHKKSATKNNTISKQLHDAYSVLWAIKNDSVFDQDVNSIAYERYLRVLINLATKSDTVIDKNTAKMKLKTEVMKSKDFRKCRSKKLQLMAFGTAYLYPIYIGVRFVYDKINGTAERYKIE